MTKAEQYAIVAILKRGNPGLGTYGKIFISYRREDAPGDARGICDRLGHSFGAANIFMDVDRILAGQRFDRELDKALAKCDVLIAVIGSRWMELLSDYAQHGKRDYVRDEIAAALQRDIIVIPVMIGREANMPPLPLAENLPENIRDLVLYQKHNIAHETFGRDAADLVAALKTVLGARRGPRPWRAIAATGFVGLVLAGAAIGYWMDILPGIKPPAQDHAVASSTTAAIINPDVASQKAEAEARKEEEARKKAEADVKAADDAAKTRAAEEQAAKRAADAEAARQKAEAEAKAADDAARKKADADVKAADEAARKKAAEDLAAKQAADTEAAWKADQQAKLGIVTDCDRLAASSTDNDRPSGVAGVPDSKIEFAATAACDDAMRRYPETVRFVYQAGRAALARKDYAKAADLFRGASEKGYAGAFTGLGFLYYNGFGVAQDYAEARNQYTKAAERGNSLGMSNLGFLYENGRGVAQDYAEARRWFEKGAALGDGAAMNNLGWLYENGRGVTQDYAEARRLYEKGAALGGDLAMYNLGWLYENGRGVTQDYVAAREWFEKAAALGNSSAMLSLGQFYEEGRGGVPRSREQARKWYQKAADAGNEFAKTKLKNLN